MRQSASIRLSLAFVLVAFVCLLFADLQISTSNPWQELGRLALGVVTPDFAAVDYLGKAVIRTLAFAFVGVALGAGGGFMLALCFRHRVIRAGCAIIRAVHELFWALLFLQCFGLHPLTGVLAIAIPYAGIFAKVYAEILDETDPEPAHALPASSGRLSTLLYTRLPLAWSHLVSYTAYRLECGLRSSAVLGFIGMPTLGYYLESSFAQGHYSSVGALLLIFYVLIATLKLWVRPRLLPLYLMAAPFLLGSGLPIAWSNVSRFLTQDVIPAPIRSGEGIAGLGPWLGDLLTDQALPGILNTLLLTQIALVLTGALALLLFPLVSSHFTRRLSGTAGHMVLVILRSTPEYLLAFILLQLWGPSMLPAVVALAIHNGGIIGHLIGQRSNTLRLRPDAPHGVERYAYEVVPRLYGPFLALLFYRWEIIMRETAILGILGVATLGFYIDSAIQEIRIDRALVLILITALLNIGIDSLARHLRARLRLRYRANSRQGC
ncbi:PhnE/PtxC family ABC transporter permease [Aidingimonas halophila]|uniref:Phosphonate transport system permease protein n=1 Tax=Aidingimonas halophila TaxID=574349 RepID=A0A1H2SU84_9GAMM|nr:ABC transporter permease [Aidingimonas halophila]GHC17154.1 phosphate ABC transporter permease [Aidingimonas halophila]SDW35015.1 phosphonate transport system permease protein [Aidingimonas halophila]